MAAVKHKTQSQIFSEQTRGEHSFLRKVKRQGKGRSDTPAERRERNPVPGSLNIQAPEKISIYEHTEGEDNYTETIAFVNKIIENFGRVVCAINFSNTAHISSAALVVVYAAMDTARKAGLVKSTIVWSAVSPRVNQHIRKSNLQKIVHNKSVKYQFIAGERLPVVGGHGNLYVDDIVDYINTSFFSDKMDANEEHTYADALLETVNNVRLHAYPEKIEGQ